MIGSVDLDLVTTVMLSSRFWEKEEAKAWVIVGREVKVVVYLEGLWIVREFVHVCTVWKFAHEMSLQASKESPFSLQQAGCFLVEATM